MPDICTSCNDGHVPSRLHDVPDCPSIRRKARLANERAEFENKPARYFVAPYTDLHAVDLRTGRRMVFHRIICL